MKVRSLIFHHLSDPTASFSVRFLMALNNNFTLQDAFVSKGTGQTAALWVSGRKSPRCSVGHRRLQQKRQGGLCFSLYTPQVKLICPPPASSQHFYYLILHGSSRITSVGSKEGISNMDNWFQKRRRQQICVINLWKKKIYINNASAREPVCYQKTLQVCLLITRD